MDNSRSSPYSVILRWVLPSVSITTLIALGGLMFLVVIIASSAVAGDQGAASEGVKQPLPVAVEGYREIVTQTCVKYDLSDYVDLILAIMAQESGGEGLDPMQASESPFNDKYPKKPGGITDPAFSIECGVKMFNLVKEKAGVESPYDMPHIKLALQGYNYGDGYITWALGQPDAGYTQENAIQFSEMKALELGWESYGDIYYVNHVLRYYLGAAGGEGTGTGQFTWPVPGYTVLKRGFILNGDGSVYHRGLDIPAPIGTNIVAADGGVVEVAIYGHYSYGNYIQIDHGNGYKSVYAHCVGLNAAQGQSVSRGEVIAFIGSTGNSTGPHLHFEISMNGALIDPASVL